LEKEELPEAEKRKQKIKEAFKKLAEAVKP